MSKPQGINSAMLDSMRRASESSNPSSSSSFSDHKVSEPISAEPTSGGGTPQQASEFYEAGGSGFSSSIGGEASFMAMLKNSAISLGTLAENSLNSMMRWFGNAFGNNPFDQAFDQNTSPFGLSGKVLEDGNFVGNIGFENLGPGEQLNAKKVPSIFSSSEGASR